MNKSKMIREAISSGITRNIEIVRYCARKGATVSTNYVSVIKSSNKNLVVEQVRKSNEVAKNYGDFASKALTLAEYSKDKLLGMKDMFLSFENSREFSEVVEFVLDMRERFNKAA